VRGAVLSALGMRVHEQVLRRHYGTILWRPFEFGDPTELHQRDLDGELVCTKAFHWYGHMVIVFSPLLLCFQDEHVSYGHEVEELVELLCDQSELDRAKAYPYEHDLWISEESEAPKYNWKVSGNALHAAFCLHLRG
jgi:hypothetical protein